MNELTAKKLLENTLNYPFNERQFVTLISNVFKIFHKKENFSFVKNQYSETTKHIDSHAHIGEYVNKHIVVDIYAVRLSNDTSLDSGRIHQRNFVAKLIEHRGSKAAIVAFIPTSSRNRQLIENWRFSLVTVDYETENKNGKIDVKSKYSSAKRFSFLVGKNEPNHTAQKQILPLLTKNTGPSITTLQSAFSVEKVSKEFFLRYKKNYLAIVSNVNNLIESDEKLKIAFETSNVKSDHFSQKLLGQLVFLYFVQKKGWLGVSKDIEGNFMSWGTGDYRFLQNLFEKKYVDYQNFHNDVLQPLFYQTLATEREKGYSRIFDCRIPFLGSGLFEPINNYNWKETNLLIDDNIFQLIFSTFDRFNFTVKEDDPLDKEIAIDPEVLGKVFENMLPENMRKGSGTYYTPRSIVEYMSQECIINYLEGKIPTLSDNDSIKRFIKGSNSHVFRSKEKTVQTAYSFREEDLPEEIIARASEIDQLLADIKICDPAVGSGAFPIGILHEIVNAREILTDYCKENRRSRYDLKRDCIQNSIYGVDIDSAAIEIAKLRLWLCLVVEENEISEIKPLPNLYFKLMQGNSLIQTFHSLSTPPPRIPRWGGYIKEVNTPFCLTNCINYRVSISAKQSKLIN